MENFYKKKLRTLGWGEGGDENRWNSEEKTHVAFRKCTHDLEPSYFKGILQRMLWGANSSTAELSLPGSAGTGLAPLDFKALKF